MDRKELKKYTALNELSRPDGIVIFGGTEDLEIPLCELKQAFALEPGLYNRSIRGLSILDALSLYDSCVAPLEPSTLLLHIGADDLSYFEEYPADFDKNYRELISHIRSRNTKCRIAVISLKNPENNGIITNLNQHLKYMTESMQCEYGDITARRVWNPKSTMDVVSFIYSTGFIRPLKNNRPIYDLIKILFCCTL